MATRESKADFEKLIDRASPPIRIIARGTRALVLDIFPDALERTYWGWGNTWYGTSDKNRDAVFSISPMKSYVQLHFLRGTEQSDPDGLLEGIGKKLRHVKIRTAAELKRTSLHRLMKRAVVHSRKGGGE